MRSIIVLIIFASLGWIFDSTALVVLGLVGFLFSMCLPDDLRSSYREIQSEVNREAMESEHRENITEESEGFNESDTDDEDIDSLEDYSYFKDVENDYDIFKDYYTDDDWYSRHFKGRR